MTQSTRDPNLIHIPNAVQRLKERVPLIGRMLRFAKRSVLLQRVWKRQLHKERDRLFLVDTSEDERHELLSVHDGAERAFLLQRFLCDDVWEELGIAWQERRDIYMRLVDCHTEIRSATDVWRSMLYFIEVLRAAQEHEGDVIECGCFQGATTACLSIACSLIDRRLVVCDSFEGLPAPAEADRVHQNYMLLKGTRGYESGQFKGSLDLVRENVERYGEVSTCSFVRGWFSDTLPNLAGSQDYSFIFAVLDVDLYESTRDCLLYVWPRLQNGCRLYTDDGGELDTASIFFNAPWWRRQFGHEPPGLYGAGFGINFFQAKYSSIGLAVKGQELATDQVETMLSH